MPSFAETIRQAMRLDPEIFALVQTSQQGVIVALAVMLLASISEAVGQSIVLFLNRVRPWRFVLAQVIAVLSNVIAYVLWALVIWGVIWLVFGVREPLVATLAVVGLAYAPQLFAFFEMTPWLGNTFGVFLSLWSMAAVVVALQGGMGLTMIEAALTGLASWVVIQLFRRSLGRPIYALGRYIQRGASGSPMTFSMTDLYEGNLNREDFSASVRQYSSTAVSQYVGASVDGASVVGAPVLGAPAVGASVVGAPAVGASVDGASVDSASVDSASVDSASVDSASVDGAPVDGASVDGASVDGAVVDSTPVEDSATLGTREDQTTKLPTHQTTDAPTTDAPTTDHRRAGAPTTGAPTTDAPTTDHRRTEKPGGDDAISG